LSLVNPEFLPGFSASVDYYRIRATGIVSSLTAQQEVNFCFAGLQQYCSAFNLAPTSGTPFVNVQSFNLASIYTKGIDFEASYQKHLDSLGIVTFRGLATHVIRYSQNSGIANTIPTELAGVNVGTASNTPNWKVYMTQSWDISHFGVDLTERWVSAGVFGNQYIVCQSNCPIYTPGSPAAVNNPTINNNHMAGALYLDLGGRYSITDSLTTFVKIDNVLNRDPVAAPQTNTGLDVNPALYDTIGRVYRLGVRYNF
jgi:iron complex outermembrane recepter protein